MLRLSFLLLCCVVFSFTSCRKRNVTSQSDNGAFAKAKTNATGPVVDRIMQSGELIIGTISGPDTYFDYQGRGMGLQYALAEDFATTLGVGVRVELATDSLQLVKMLKQGEVDLIAYPLSSSFCKKEHITAAGAINEKSKNSWATLSTVSDLIEALNDWFGDGVELKAKKQEADWLHNRRVVRRKVRAPFISREKGIISTYDSYFKDAARAGGWDWRLFAAQCYQESGFDPNAVSWAGACGLMQLMPATAAQYGLSRNQIFGPSENIAVAARHIQHLQQQFASIREPQERVKFVLAAYNGGLGHIRDAQSLARKHGGNANLWSDVGYYVRNLSQPQFYRDPVVKHGYMIGSETYGYVQSIFDRWRQYGGNVHSLGVSSVELSSSSANKVRSGSDGERITPHKKNRYSRSHIILSPEELQKQAQ